MTSAEHNDLVPAQEKLEWVTPKISLMGAGDTDGKLNFFIRESVNSSLKDFFSQVGAAGPS